MGPEVSACDDVHKGQEDGVSLGARGRGDAWQGVACWEWGRQRKGLPFWYAPLWSESDVYDSCSVSSLAE